MLDKIKQIDRDYLTPKEVASVLGCMPYAINVAAKTDPKKLGFPIIRIGNRVKIPKDAFIRFMGGN